MTRTPYAELSPDELSKARARARARVALVRGEIERRPCVVAGCTRKPELHHHDYAKPLEVEFVCRRHHLELHHS